MSDQYQKPHKLDNLESKLYSPRQEIEVKGRKPLRPKEYAIAQDWEHAPSEPLEESNLSVDKNKKNWFLRFFVLAFLFFLGALGYVGYQLFFDTGIDAGNVDILVNAPLTVGAGENFEFDVLLQNKNQMNMQTVDVVVDFPDGTRSSADIAQDYTSVREELGDISIGAIAKKNYTAVLFGEEGDKKEMTVSISYRVEGSNSVFQKEKKFEVVLKSTPVRLTVTNVREITSGQPLTFNVEIVSNSTETLQNVVVQATYPFGFQYQTSSIQPKEDKKTWVIPQLKPKEVVRFTINGVLEGQNNEERYFSFVTGLEDPDSGSPEVVFSKTGTTVTLARPFLELDIAINRNNSDVIALDADAIYNAMISFKNNTSDPLRNVILTLQLNGSAINKNTIQAPEGFYQSTNNTIIWDQTTTDGLSFIPVGTSGTVSFNFSGLGRASNILLNNPEMIFVAQVEGNRNPDNEVPEIIENSITKKIRFNTQASIASRSEYYSNTFLNTGPMPPIAEQKTTYTAVVELTNPSNRIQNGIITMMIPNYVTYENKFAPANENVSYDAKTRMLSWNIGTIEPKTGFEGNPSKKISFQVSIVPSVSQVGTAPNLVYDIKFSGTDTYTNETITRTAGNISTGTSDSRSFYDSQVSR